MAVANAGTNYGASDDELAAVFDEMFDKYPDIEADVGDDTIVVCWTTVICGSLSTCY